MREAVGADRVRALLRALGEVAADGTRLYLTGGASAVLQGWRDSTIDVDVKLVPDSDAVLAALPGVKESLRVNVELASPADFIPELPGWEDRCEFVEKDGGLSVYHYDFYAQALAKLERGHVQDRADAAEMLRRGLIRPAELRRLYDAIEPRLYRYPAIEPAAFRASVQEFLATGSGG